MVDYKGNMDMAYRIIKTVSSHPYYKCLTQGHPNSDREGYVLEHRIVMEQHIGRLLKPGEVVHHKDGNKKNNSIDNLALDTDTEHRRHHATVNNPMHKKGDINGEGGYQQ